MKKGKFNILAMVLVLVMILGLTACGSGGKDALQGTWIGEDEDYGDVTWTFDGKGACTLNTDVTDQKGTYELTEDAVSIALELWDSPKDYDYTVSEGTLSLTDPAGMAPEYQLKKK